MAVGHGRGKCPADGWVTALLGRHLSAFQPCTLFGIQPGMAHPIVVWSWTCVQHYRQHKGCLLVHSGLQPDLTTVSQWLQSAGTCQQPFEACGVWVNGKWCTILRSFIPFFDRQWCIAQAASLAGGLIGPAVGGVLADRAGLRAPFMLTGVAALAAALYGFVRLPETRVARAQAHARGEVLDAEPASTANLKVRPSRAT